MTPKKLDVALVDHFRSANHFSEELFSPLVDHFGADHLSPIILVGQDFLHSSIITWSILSGKFFRPQQLVLFFSNVWKIVWKHNAGLVAVSFPRLRVVQTNLIQYYLATRFSKKKSRSFKKFPLFCRDGFYLNVRGTYVELSFCNSTRTTCVLQGSLRESHPFPTCVNLSQGSIGEPRRVLPPVFRHPDFGFSASCRSFCYRSFLDNHFSRRKFPSCCRSFWCQSF